MFLSGVWVTVFLTPVIVSFPIDTTNFAGVVKTHRLLLTQTDLIAPHITPSSIESQVTIGPRTLKDMLEHFPHSKSSKSDPQLVWRFAANDVKVKSMELSGAKCMSPHVAYG